MYSFEFEINELPKTINEMGRKHWSMKAKHSREWQSMVGFKVVNNRPPMPLMKATLELTRYSSRQPDFDNLVISFKAVIDALIVCKVLVDDKPSNIGQSKYFWEKAPHGKGKIKVKIEEIK